MYLIEILSFKEIIMNSTKLNISNNLISSIDNISVSSIENAIKKYVNDFQTTLIFILAIPFLYISLFFISLIISYNLIKKYKKYMNFQNSSEYRELRLLYDFTTQRREKMVKMFDDSKKKNKFWYYLLSPLKLVFFRVNKYENEAMKKFKALDSPTKEGSLFRSISEAELWERRTKAYQYKL